MIFSRKTRTRLFWTIIMLAVLLSAVQISANPRRSMAGSLVINEFVAANGTGLMDEDGDYSDWIELYNAGSQPVNLAGWALTDDPDQPIKWPFPDLTIAPQEYLVIFASGKNRRGSEPGAALHTNFNLGKEGMFLGLHNILENNFVDALSPHYPEQRRDIAYGRYGPDQAFGYLAIPTPGGPNNEARVWADIAPAVQVSAPHGYYDTPFTVELTSPTPTASIRYTTDGSLPTESNGALYEQPLAIERTTLLRAVAIQPGALPSAVTTRSYIFLDDVLVQSAAPPGFPTSWGTHLVNAGGLVKVAPVPSDYEMVLDPGDDPPVNEDTLRANLTELPVVSLVMDMPSFAGIHARSFETGREAEHPVSVELFLEDQTTPGFQVNAGLRVRQPLNQAEAPLKQSFQLFFRGDYGETRLSYPLFSSTSVQEFDTLVLQSGSDSSFSNLTPRQERLGHLRNEWLRRSQLAMSDVATHGMFVHLYLNGLYWGVYNLMEVPDAAFAASYMGGDEDDWFLADRHGPLSENRRQQATKIHHLFTTLGFASHVTGEMQSQDYLSETLASVASTIDPLQFSDYMILAWYAEAQGWPASDWHAAVRLEDLPAQGKFLITDLVSPPADSGSPAQAAPDIIAMLFDTMRQNPDFNIQLADRIYKHLFNDGALTDKNAQARWQEIHQSVDGAIAGEAARWGDSSPDQPFTPTDWQRVSQEMLAQLDGTAGQLLVMAREAGYYPAFDPPRLSHPGGVVEANFTLTLERPASASRGTIYYTLDGTDPRLPVTGEVSPIANVYQGPITLNYNSQLKARIRQDESWSALQEATFKVVPQDFKLRITEIMYNPIGGDGYEFIELKNTGGAPVNLASHYFDEGVRFVFPPNTPPLGPNQFALLVSDPATFASRYPGVPIMGAYEGQLSNKGERVALKDPLGQTLLAVDYQDENGWPITPDGRGDSLHLAAPDGDPGDPRNWRASANLYGSPGADEPARRE